MNTKISNLGIDLLAGCPHWEDGEREYVEIPSAVFVAKCLETIKNQPDTYPPA